MINLGIVRPGSTIQIPLESFATATGAPITLTGLATSDILVYKDGSTTERASASGYAVSADFDSKTGLHYITIDLSDNTTADFWAAGSRYAVAIADVTVDSQTMRVWGAIFQIGIHGAVLDTTIATLSSQTSFTLAAGPADNDALNGAVAVIWDAASAVQMALGVVLDYTGASKTVTLAADPGVFTMAAKDNISFIPGGVNAYREAINATYGLSAIKTLSDTIAGYLDTEIAAILAAVDTEVAAIKTKTDNLPTDPADESLLEAAIADLKTYVDTEILAIKAQTDLIPADPATETSIAAIPAAVGALVVHTGITLIQSLRMIGAMVAGKTSGAGTGTVTFRNPIDTLDAMIITMTGSNRTATTKDLSA